MTRKEKSWQLVLHHYYRASWEHAFTHYEKLVAQNCSAEYRVLDIGCGRTFEFARRLSSLCREAHGVDPVADASAASLPPNATLRKGTAQSLPFADDSFDLAICKCVLEHLADPQQALAEVRRVLKPGGRMVFLTPNKLDYVSLAAMLVPNCLHARLVRFIEGRAEADTFGTFYRANTLRALRRLATAAGFEVKHLQRHNNYPSSFMFSPLLCRAAIGYDKLICRLRLDSLKAWIMGELTSTKLPRVVVRVDKRDDSSVLATRPH